MLDIAATDGPGPGSEADRCWTLRRSSSCFCWCSSGDERQSYPSLDQSKQTPAGVNTKIYRLTLLSACSATHLYATVLSIQSSPRPQKPSRVCTQFRPDSSPPIISNHIRQTRTSSLPKKEEDIKKAQRPFSPLLLSSTFVFRNKSRESFLSSFRAISYGGL